MASAAAAGVIVQPVCTALPTGQLQCVETGAGDPRNVFQICPSTAQVFGNVFPDTPYFVLDSVLNGGCEVAMVYFAG